MENRKRGVCPGFFSGTNFYFNQAGQLLGTTISGGTQQNEYVYFNGVRVAANVPTNTIYYYFGDQIGSLQTVTNASGTVCYDGDYTPLGFRNNYTSSCPQEFGFAGMKLEAEIPSYNTMFREYGYGQGRWLAPDPIAGDVSNPQSLNRYTYAQNNPVSLTDLLGLDAGQACGAFEARFAWFTCPFSGSGGASGGGGWIPPDLCFDDPLPDPTCGMPPGIGPGGGGGGVGGGGPGNVNQGFPDSGHGIPGLPPQLGGIEQAIQCALFPLSCLGGGGGVWSEYPGINIYAPPPPNSTDVPCDFASCGNSWDGNDGIQALGQVGQITRPLTNPCTYIGWLGLAGFFGGYALSPVFAAAANVYIIKTATVGSRIANMPGGLTAVTMAAKAAKNAVADLCNHMQM